MPKIIKDIKPKIINAAKELFEVESYENIDMRTIAKNSNIAVGTLYNHFPNKEALFLNILELSWKDTIEKLYNIDLSKESVNEVITLLYDSISRRKGLGLIMMRSKQDVSELMTNITNSIRVAIALHTEYYYKGKDTDISLLNRKLDTIFIVIAEISRKYPDERDLNIEYLTGILIGGNNE